MIGRLRRTSAFRAGLSILPVSLVVVIAASSIDGVFCVGFSLFVSGSGAVFELSLFDGIFGIVSVDVSSARSLFCVAVVDFFIRSSRSSNF